MGWRLLDQKNAVEERDHDGHGRGPATPNSCGCAADKGRVNDGAEHEWSLALAIESSSPPTLNLKTVGSCIITVAI